MARRNGILRDRWIVAAVLLLSAVAVVLVRSGAAQPAQAQTAPSAGALAPAFP